MENLRRLYGVVLVLTALLCLPCRAAESEAVVLNAHWVRHEYQPYCLSRLVYTIDGRDTVSVERLWLRADVSVADSSSRGYRLSWRIHYLSVETDHYLSRQWADFVDHFEFDYPVSRQGVMTGSDLPKRLEALLNGEIDRFFAQYKGKTTLESRERLYRLRDGLAEFLLSAVGQLHQAYGLGYVVGEVVPVPVKMAYGDRGQEVDAVVYKKLESCKDGVATLVSSTVMDTAQVNRLLRQALEPGASLPVWQQEDLGALVMHLSSGWVLYSSRRREVREGRYIYGDENEISIKQ